jgi:hypothetical protein
MEVSPRRRPVQKAGGNARAFLLTNKDRRRKYEHELTNGWITRGEHRFRFDLSGSFVAVICTC